MKPSKKQRLSVYVEPAILRSLAEYAARRDHSLSLVAEAAIASFLSPDAAERQEAATTKRLDQIDRRMTADRARPRHFYRNAGRLRPFLADNEPAPAGAFASCGTGTGRRAL